MSRKFERINEIAEATVKAVVKGDVAGSDTLPEDFYGSQLPEGLTPEIANQVHVADRDFVAGVAKGYGKVALQTLKEQPDLSETTLQTTAGQGNPLTIRVERSRTYKVSAALTGGKDAEPVTNYGVTTVKLTNQAAVTGSGVLKSVLKEIAAAGKEQLAETEKA
jgi:uncharacterized protein YlxP (DUF503 family)